MDCCGYHDQIGALVASATFCLLEPLQGRSSRSSISSVLANKKKGYWVVHRWDDLREPLQETVPAAECGASPAMS